MRENAQTARPTLADRQVPASSSTEHGHLSSLFQRFEDGASGHFAPRPRRITPGDDVHLASAEATKGVAFEVFKLAGNGEAVLLEGAASLDAAVARVVGFREWFPGEYLIVSQATGRRILFSEQGVGERR